MERSKSPTHSTGILWLVLDEASQARLREVLPPMYAEPYYHHVTLLYGVTQQEAAPYVGQEHKIEGYAHAFNENAQALRVRTENLPDMYGVPHITLSTPEGIEPFASVAMLQGDHTEQALDVPLALTGVVGFKPIQSR